MMRSGVTALVLALGIYSVAGAAIEFTPYHEGQGKVGMEAGESPAAPFMYGTGQMTPPAQASGVPGGQGQSATRRAAAMAGGQQLPSTPSGGGAALVGIPQGISPPGAGQPGAGGQGGEMGGPGAGGGPSANPSAPEPSGLLVWGGLLALVGYSSRLFKPGQSS